MEKERRYSMFRPNDIKKNPSEKNWREEKIEKEFNDQCKEQNDSERSKDCTHDCCKESDHGIYDPKDFVKRSTPQNNEEYWDKFIDKLRKEEQLFDCQRRAYEKEHGKGVSKIFTDFCSPLSTGPYGPGYVEREDLERAIQEIDEIRAKWRDKGKQPESDPKSDPKSDKNNKPPLTREDLSWYHGADFRGLYNKDKVRYVSVFLALRGATLLSDEYSTNKDAYKIHCNTCEHDFYSSFNNLQAGHWCPTCRGTHVIGIRDVQALVEFKKGTLVSTTYKNNHTSMDVHCNEGHDFKITYNMIQRGRWCPYCHIYVAEEITRNYFERIFQADFPKTKPNWLLSEKGFPMELDGYCEKLKIAFEYQGIEHYQPIELFKIDKERLKQIQIRDKLKHDICKKNDITLIHIPPDDEVPYDKIQEHIISEYKKITGIQLKDIPKYDFTTFDINPAPYLKRAEEIITEKEGTLISTTFISCRSKLNIKCKMGHDFKTSFNGLRDDDWCPKCVKKARHTLEEARELVEKNGWTLISTEYVNNSTPLEIICNKEHHIWMSYLAVDQGQNCGKCSGKTPHTLEDATELVRQRGGILISTEYIKNNSFLDVECARRHHFSMTYTDMQGGHWCKYCAKDYVYSVQEKQNYIENRGGILQGDIIQGSNQSLQIQCNSCKQTFNVNFKEILKGKWCPKCPDKINIRKLHSSDYSEDDNERKNR
jgi:Zn finger protein HypA/HybF involved in hydrogenase expression